MSKCVIAFKYQLHVCDSCKFGVVFVQVKYQQKYEQEIKGKASTDAGAAEFAQARENAEHLSQVT